MKKRGEISVDLRWLQGRGMYTPDGEASFNKEPSRVRIPCSMCLITANPCVEEAACDTKLYVLNRDREAQRAFISLCATVHAAAAFATVRPVISLLRAS